MEIELCAVAPADWEIKSIAEVCQRVTSGGTPSRREPAYYEGGVWPWIKTQELQDVWIENTEEHITEDAVAASSAKVLPANTVLVAMYGATVGQLGILRRPMTCNQACCALIADSSKVDFRFLYFQLLQARSELKSLATGAAQQNLSGVLIKSLRLPFPPLPEQRAIAHILGTLDDKIELNRRRNQTLEAMARALFKDWFVDFGPVCAKLEGREPYLPAELWQLFPDRLDDEGKPEGWEMAPLSAFASLVTTSVSPSKSPDIMFEHYSIPAFDAGRMPAMQLGKTIKSNKYIVDADAVLVSKLNPQTPRVWLPDVATERAICSTEFMQFVPRDRKNRPYLYYLMSSQAMQEEVLKHVTGSTGSRQRAQPAQIAKVEAILPQPGTLMAFNQQAVPILNAIAENRRESRTLAQLRDTLLPKLISGELRVKDAEQFLGRVAV